MMAADEKQVSALIRRHEQIKRWEGSDTFLEPCSPKKDNIKVKFQDGCVFLAACSSGDKEEVAKLLQKGADINTANVDGLTALHQACIDDNLDMVEFLVEHAADVDVCDNEGWTPLHATASCAFTEIARYLMKHGANVAAVNNDGDLPMDIAENDEMEKLLKEEMDRQGIDADAARCEEEQRMLEDANQWLRDRNVEEILHPKTGATALHVAAAKGYMKVMSLLLDAGVNVDAEDYDGWTPLHAAAHWGQDEACKLLAEHGCNMMYKNKAGHTALDLAEKDMLKLLEELKEKQAALRSKHEIETDHILTSGGVSKRRSSVTRMSVDQKQNVIQRTSEEERAALVSIQNEDKIPSIHQIAKVQEEKEAEDAETERRNEKNKQVSNQTQQPSTPTTLSTSLSWSRPTTVATTSGVDTRLSDMPKIEEAASDNDDRPDSIARSSTVITTVSFSLPASGIASTTVTSSLPAPSSVSAPSSKPATSTPSTNVSAISTLSVTNTVVTSTTSGGGQGSNTGSTAVLVSKPAVSVTRLTDRHSDVPSTDSSVQKTLGKLTIPSSLSSSGRDLVSRSISVPARLPTQKEPISSLPTTTTATATTTTTTAPSLLTSSGGELSLPSWRLGLRKTGSSSMVHEWMSHNDGDALPRSASSPRLAPEFRLDTLQERLASRRPLSSTGSSQAATVTTTATSSVTTTSSSLSTSTTNSDIDSGRIGDRNSYTFGQSYSGYRSALSGRPGSYVPFHLRQQLREADEKQLLEQPQAPPGARDRSTYCGHTSLSSPASSSSTSSPSTTNSIFKRSYEPPKRDEETETQRKARAKHARQTRRSTQGVSLEDLEKAEEVLRSNDSTKVAKDSTDGPALSLSTSLTTTTTTTTTRNSFMDRDSSSGGGLSRSASGVATVFSTATGTTTTATTSLSNTDADTSSQREDRFITSGYRRRALEDRNDTSNVDTSTSRYRRAREERDLTSSSSLGSADITSSYVPRSQRNNALLQGDSSLGTSSSQNLLRSSSLRAGRLRNGDTSDLSSSSSIIAPRSEEDQRGSRDESSQEKKEEKKEPSAIRARRQRRERRSTGITYDNDDNETSKENKPEEDRKEDNLGSSRFSSSRYGSNSDAPGDRSQRPVSYSEFSRSTSSLDIDYKKKYEDEKSENERLRKELEDTKKSLLEAKTELDRAMRQRDANRNIDRDKRALERKLSEMEEELKLTEKLKAENKKLKEENRALTRVVAKLSQ